MDRLDQTVNLKVKITNLLDQTITASIYGFSASQDVLALKVFPANGNKSTDVYKIVNTAFIKSVQVLPPLPKKGQKLQTCNGKLTKVDINQFQSHLNKLIDKSKQMLPLAEITTEETKAPNKEPEISPLARKLFSKLTEKLGPENVQWHGNESMLLFKEIIVSKPYALNKISHSKRSQSSKHINKVKIALRDTWLEIDNAKRGG